MSGPSAQPFAGVTVLEFGHFIAVPWAGQVLADGGAHVIKVEPLEGDWTPKRIVALEFPSVEQAQKWYRSDEYAPLIKLRQRASRGKLILVEGA